MDDGFWLGLQRERTRLAWNRTLEALIAGQVVVAVDGLRTRRVPPTLVGLALLLVTIALVGWQYRTSHERHGDLSANPAQRLAVVSLTLCLLGVGGVLMVLT